MSTAEPFVEVQELPVTSTVKVELPASPLSLATLPLSLATLPRHSPSPLSLAPPWGHASPDGFASYGPRRLPGAPPIQNPPSTTSPPVAHGL
jgi:hypothetical protein